MAQAKVPKFGAWKDGEENYTTYFDNARKKKTNGHIMNPNDPQENPDMFPQNGGPAAQQPSRAADSKGGQPSEPPQFGAWDNGDGYTAYFENKQKAKNNGQSNVPVNEPQMNRDMLVQGQPQARPQQPAKLEPQRAPKEAAQSKVPQFGDWEGEGEDGNYTRTFDNVRKNNNKNNERSVTPEPSSNPPPPKEGRATVPPFGTWDDGESGAYTAYFENAAARKNKNVAPVVDNNVEPQLNRDVNNNRPRPPAAGAAKNKIDDQHQLRNASKGSNSSESAMRAGRQNAGGQSPIHQKGGRLQQKQPARGSQTPDRGAAIPAFGVWHSDPNQAEGFTGAFQRAKEERNTPLNSNAPPRHDQYQRSQDKKKKGCFGCF